MCVLTGSLQQSNDANLTDKDRTEELKRKRLIGKKTTWRSHTHCNSDGTTGPPSVVSRKAGGYREILSK